jgi:thimet oligopeptidase
MPLSQISQKLSSSQDIIKLFPTDVTGINKIKAQAIAWVDQVAKIIDMPIPEQNYQNTFGLLDQISYEFGANCGILNIIENAHPDEAIRNTAQAAVLELSNMATLKLSLNKALYQALKNYTENNCKLAQLSPEQTYFIDQTMAGFKRAGLNLPEPEFVKVQTLTQELNKLTQEFSKNINEDNRTINFELAELAGTPKNTIASLAKAADGKLVVKAQIPTLVAILDNCTIAETRKETFDFFVNIAYPKNQSIFQQIVNTRDELAKTIGFASYTDLDLDDQMAQNIAIVESFIDSIITPAQIKAAQEFKLFLATEPQCATMVNANNQVWAWDVRYLKNNYRKHNLNLDMSQISEYFPLEHTLNKLLEIYEKFMGLKFKRQTANLWFQNLELLEVYRGDLLIGHIILDLYPRENKYNHAACFPVAPTIKVNQQIVPGLNAVIANFPQATADVPALMTYDDVKTFFHEFGHALHGLLGATEIASLSGTSVKTDFVEMPSQMLENWLTDPEILKLVSKHYQTGAPLPTATITALAKLKQFDSGDFICRQLCFARMSLAYFKAGQNKDTQKIMFDILANTRPYVALYANDHMVEGWGHVASSGYAAKYYGYMWSDVFAKDLFEKIKTGGLLNPTMGCEYIDKVIGKGGAQDPNELIADFLGRKPNQAAFIKSMGL